MLRTLIIGLVGGVILCCAIAVAPAQELEPASAQSTTPATTSVVAPVEPTPATTGPAAQTLEPTPAAMPTVEPALVPNTNPAAPPSHQEQVIDYTSLLYVFMLATFIGLGVILRVSRLLHTPLMSLTNAISAIAVVGSIIVTGNPDPHMPTGIRILGAIALFASMTNIVSGFLITDRMLKMFKTPRQGGQR